MDTPGELSEALMKQSAEYCEISDKLTEILKYKPESWLRIRATCESDARAEKTWASMPYGVDETVYRLKLKALEKSMSAIKTRLRVMESEARNLF